MGCDGGTIPKRGELVRTKKNPEKKDKESDLSFKWGHCSITQEPLQQPIVACQLGRLYNKTSVIEAILDQTKLPDMYKHIKSLKDVKELNLTDNPEFSKASEIKEARPYSQKVISPYICPLIGLEMNGKYRFVYFWSCGCALSERALKEIKSNNCLKCQKTFTDEDVIVLNGTEEDTKVLEKRMLERQARLKAEKKLKKAKQAAENGTATATATSAASTSNEGLKCNSENIKQNGTTKNQTKCASEVNGSTFKMASKRPNEKGISDPDFKKTRMDYSVAKDPKATEVFKSLFTTHKSAENKAKAHWITYNPFYN